MNPTGKFVIGGPMGDTGLTGRKIVVDTYGGAAPHGGGAFSGKDPTKVDRSAAYAARYVAKNVVAAGLADRCQLQVAYAIGVAHPMSVNVDCFGTEAIPLAKIEAARRRSTSTSGRARSSATSTSRRPIYAKTAAYGHFGRDDRDFTWERTDKADALRSAAGLGAASVAEGRRPTMRRSAVGSEESHEAAICARRSRPSDGGHSIGGSYDASHRSRALESGL